MGTWDGKLGIERCGYSFLGEAHEYRFCEALSTHFFAWRKGPVFGRCGEHATEGVLRQPGCSELASYDEAVLLLIHKA